MSSLEIYRDVLLAHNEQPHNFYAMPNPTHIANGHNPLCGDEITVYLQMEAGNIKNISFTGQGCAVCKASASLMTLRLEGKQAVEAESDAQCVLMWLKDILATQPINLGQLEALIGVRNFPMRIKCATLAWHAFLNALQHPHQSSDQCSNTCACCRNKDE
jgi:nitrogen fixation NifU-like protein